MTQRAAEEAPGVSTVLTERSWCVMVPHDARGARGARHRLADELTGIVPATLLADVEMVAAELLGNAVRHAEPLPGRLIRLTWSVRPGPPDDEVVIRVTDGGATAPPQLRRVGPDAVDGRGLFLVAALAARWGVERDGLGQSVWARLAHPADRELAPVG
ncbi:ATP-binding protein [Plantactinospora alkalitolerans]|uniref:ATP-binding protein n=1 Tax=Plantactinospora alkalitolerans TaxID=2789879 RepID=UPI0038999C10